MVIAYLHLVLFHIISVFLLTYVWTDSWTSRVQEFFGGFRHSGLFNEIVLAAQGIGSFSYTVIPYSNEILFMIAVILFSSVFLLLRAQTES